MELDGKICIVTGSAQGLGKEFARRLLQAGARVTISDLKKDKGLKTMAEFNGGFDRNQVHFVPCDVTDREQLEYLFSETERFFKGPVDIFVNNAGVNTNLGWKLCMKVNVLAVMAATEMAMERMKGRPGCKVVNIGSLAGLVSGVGAECAGYFVSKTGVVALCRTLAATHHLHGVDILCLCPSHADTDICKDVTPDVKPMVEESIRNAGGLLTVQEVGEAFSQLLSSPNGTVLAVMVGLPCFNVPDTGKPLVIGLALVGQLLQTVLGVELVETKHVGMVLVAMFVIYSLLIILVSRSI